MMKELLGLICNVIVWFTVVVGYIPADQTFQQIKDVFQLIAHIVAIVLSIITARYYLQKTKKLKG